MNRGSKNPNFHRANVKIKSEFSLACKPLTDKARSSRNQLLKAGCY
jgi:hypothetical protein